MRVTITELKVSGDTEVLEEHKELVNLLLFEVILPTIEKVLDE